MFAVFDSYYAHIAVVVSHTAGLWLTTAAWLAGYWLAAG